MSFLVLIIAGALVAASVLVAAFALRQAAGEQRRQLALLMLLRLAALALILLALVNPVWHRSISRQLRPRLVILMDASASVTRHFAGAQAALKLPAAQARLGRFDPLTLHFGRGLVVPPRRPPLEPATDVSLALRQVLARYPAGPVLVISDGAETSGDARITAAEAAAVGASIYTIGIGPTQPPPNVGPIAIHAPRVVREKQPVPVRVLVRSTGYSGAQPLQLEVDGKGGASPSAALSPGQTASVKHQLPGLPVGFHLLTVKAPARPDEATEADNTRSHIIEARRDETRLVLLAGAPDPDYAALQRLVGRLPKTRVDAYVRVGPGRFLHQARDRTDRQSPDLAKLLRGAHVLLLMNYSLSAGEAARVRAFVQNGGAMGWLAGAAAGWNGSLPATATPGAAVPAPTPVATPGAGGALGQALTGATAPLWWRDAPFLAGYRLLSLSAGAEVVLRTRANQPLLVTGEFGTGVTLVFGGWGTYRWLLSQEADEQSRRLYEAFWQATIGWLSQPRERGRLVVVVDPAIAPEGQPVRLLAAIGGSAKVLAEISVRPGAPAIQTVPLSPTGDPGRYAGAVSNLAPGKYTVRFIAQTPGGTLQETRPLVVEPGGAELAVLTRQVGNLRAIAAAGGGQYRDIEQLPDLLSQIPATASTQPTTQPTHPFRTAWALAAMVLLLSLEWWMRRRWGW